jgi:hypothetical protein
VAYYQRLNNLLDVREILCRSSPQENVGQALGFSKTGSITPCLTEQTKFYLYFPNLLKIGAVKGIIYLTA